MCKITLQSFFLSSLVHHLDVYRVRLPAYTLRCMDTLELKRQILLYDIQKGKQIVITSDT